MKLTRAVGIKMKGSTTVNDIYSMGRIFKMKSEDITKKFIEFKNGLPKGTPQWVKYYFDGLADCHIGYYYKYDLHFGYWIDNKLYSVHRDHPMYYEKHGIKPSELCDRPSGHYWIDGDKPFYEG